MAPYHSRQIAEQLSRNSFPYRDPLAHVDWQGLDPGRPWLPEPTLSLFGIPAYMDADPAQHLALSHAEYLHLISCHEFFNAIHVQRLARDLDCNDLSTPEVQYRLHELRETLGQQLLYQEFLRHGGGIYRPVTPKNMPLTRHLLLRAKPDTTAYWIASFLSKELLGRYYRHIRRHPEQVAVTIHAIAGMHAIELDRHIIYIRDRLHELTQHATSGRLRLWQWLTQRLLREAVMTVCFPPAPMYRQVGFKSDHDWPRLAHQNPEHHNFVESLIRPTRHILEEYGLAE